MRRLSHKDLKNLLWFLYDCSTLRSISEFHDYLVNALKIVVPGDIYSYNELNPSTKKAIAKWAPSTLQMIPDGFAILAKYAAQNPVVPYFEQSGDGLTKRLSDFVPLRKFQHCALHNEFYLPFRIRYHLSTALVHGRKTIITLSIHRWRKDFSDGDRVLLDCLRPHIVRAFENNVLFTALQEELLSRRIALEETNKPLLSLLGNGQIRWATPPARTLLKKYRCLKSGDRVGGVVRDWVKNHGQSKDFEGTGNVRNQLEMEGDNGKVTIRMLRYSTGDTLLMLQESLDHFPISALGSLGLSPRQTEVLAWVAQGKSNPDIAAILNISVRTVQKHMEHIFTNLGIESRHAAIALALELVGKYGLS